ncbi:hypothetical protein [Kitasatospora phosalacinea]|uniref:hypothetical protein n=1 Tax=Kitasatospora phosalacinea TaxID=2065 RepID=UPI003682A494
MTGGGAETLALLRELDDPEWLEADFAVRCEAAPDDQDSSEYGRGVVPAGATVRGTRLVVCVSNVGSRALGGLGYVVVVEELPGCDHDGPSRLPGHVQRPTWADRFFGIF